MGLMTANWWVIYCVVVPRSLLLDFCIILKSKMAPPNVIVFVSRFSKPFQCFLYMFLLFQPLVYRDRLKIGHAKVTTIVWECTDTTSWKVLISIDLIPIFELFVSKLTTHLGKTLNPDYSRAQKCKTGRRRKCVATQPDYIVDRPYRRDVIIYIVFSSFSLSLEAFSKTIQKFQEENKEE
jgi:hypothetical protein